MSLPRSALFACALAGALAGCHRRDRDHRDMPSAKPVESTNPPERSDQDRPAPGEIDCAPGGTNAPAAKPETGRGTANPDPWDQPTEPAPDRAPEQMPRAAPVPTPGTDTAQPTSGVNEDQSRDGGGIPMSNHLY